MLYTTSDHNTFLRACADSRCTSDERYFLATQASLAAARESVSRADYLRAQALTGGALSTTMPIFQRAL